MKLPYPVLAGDIGGTNARYLAIMDRTSRSGEMRQVRINAFATIEEGIEEEALKGFGERPRSAVLALACPIEGSAFRLTNADRVIEPASFMQRLGLESLVVMNDFVAQGLAAASLGVDSLTQIGGGDRHETAPRIVIGPGTGLGVAVVINVSGNWTVLPGEGGHVDLGPRTAREFAIWPYLEKQDGRMSAEEAISGRGLENLHQAICRADGRDGPRQNAASITSTAATGGDPAAVEAVAMMARFLARYAGDLALVTMAKGGVYITGGIARHIMPFLLDPAFRAEFDDKAPMGRILREIPVFAISAPQPALSGIREFVTETGFELANAVRRFGA